MIISAVDSSPDCIHIFFALAALFFRQDLHYSDFISDDPIPIAIVQSEEQEPYSMEVEETESLIASLTEDGSATKDIAVDYSLSDVEVSYLNNTELHGGRDSKWVLVLGKSTLLPEEPYETPTMEYDCQSGCFLDKIGVYLEKSESVVQAKTNIPASVISYLSNLWVFPFKKGRRNRGNREEEDDTTELVVLSEGSSNHDPGHSGGHASKPDQSDARDAKPDHSDSSEDITRLAAIIMGFNGFNISNGENGSQSSDQQNDQRNGDLVPDDVSDAPPIDLQKKNGSKGTKGGKPDESKRAINAEKEAAYRHQKQLTSKPVGNGDQELPHSRNGASRYALEPEPALHTEGYIGFIGSAPEIDGFLIAGYRHDERWYDGEEDYHFKKPICRRWKEGEGMISSIRRRVIRERSNHFYVDPGTEPEQIKQALREFLERPDIFTIMITYEAQQRIKKYYDSLEKTVSCRIVVLNKPVDDEDDSFSRYVSLKCKDMGMNEKEKNE